MIVRVWHGWTKPEDATAYEHFLHGLLSALPASVSGARRMGTAEAG